MATLSESLVSSSGRKLPVHVRGDLTARRQRYLGRSYWIVKDPVGLKYYRFQDEEYAILNMLDGTKSLDEIKDLFEAEFPPQKITLEELQQFLGMLHKSGLIVAGVPGQGYELKKRRDERRRQETLAAMSNILCIRFKGIDPERILKAMYPYFRWVFWKITVVLCLTLMISAAGLILVNFDDFIRKLPDFHKFFTLQNAFLLAVCLGVTKVIHEFGHGLTCTHYGGECHEMGVMILVLTPCLYCNVSDSWMLPSKWQRAMIGFAGIYVELVIASICTFIWWNTQPGMLHYLCLNVMFLSSVSTLLFNANPLLRYDGYYILSDLVEIPNLRQKASQILTRKLSEWCLGMEQPDDPFLPERNQFFFALYSVAAVIYRWMVLFGILFFLYKVFEPVGLKILGQAIAAMSIYGIAVMPMWKLYKFFSVPGRLYQVKKVRAAVTLSLIVGAIAFVIFVPLPYRVYAPVEIRVRDALDVTVNTPGTIMSINVRPGDMVDEGELLVQLENDNLQRRILEQKAALASLHAQQEKLLRLAAVSPRVGDQLVEVESQLAKAEEHLAEEESQLEELAIMAPVAGEVIPADYFDHPENPEGDLPSWTGTPLMKKNEGAYLERGVRICQVGDPDKMEAVAYIDQSYINFIRASGEGRDDFRVEIVLDTMPFQTLHGHVDYVNKEEVTQISTRMAGKGGGPIPTTTDPKTGEEAPMSTKYIASVNLDNGDGVLQTGMIGLAKIQAKPQTLGQRLWRLIYETFEFKL